jgi:hypothetical protein
MNTARTGGPLAHRSRRCGDGAGRGSCGLRGGDAYSCRFGITAARIVRGNAAKIIGFSVFAGILQPVRGDTENVSPVTKTMPGVISAGHRSRADWLGLVVGGTTDLRTSLGRKRQGKDPLHPKRKENPDARRPKVSNRDLDAIVDAAWRAGWWGVRLGITPCSTRPMAST